MTSENGHKNGFPASSFFLADGYFQWQLFNNESENKAKQETQGRYVALHKQSKKRRVRKQETQGPYDVGLSKTRNPGPMMLVSVKQETLGP